MLCSSRMSEKLTTTSSLTGSMLKRLPPCPGIIASRSVTRDPHSTSLMAKLLPMKPRPPVMRMPFPARSGYSVIDVDSRPDCFHEEQIRLDHLPIGQRVEVKTRPVGDSARARTLWSRINKAGPTQQTSERVSIVHPVVDL